MPSPLYLPPYEPEDFIDNHLPTGFLCHFDSVAKELKNSKKLVFRGRDKYLREQEQDRDFVTTYRHVFKAFKPVFAASDPHPNVVANAFRTVWDLIRNTLNKVEKLAGKGVSLRLGPERRGKHDEPGVDCYITHVPEDASEFLATDVECPVRVMVEPANAERPKAREDTIWGDVDFRERLNDVMLEDARRNKVYGITICVDKSSHAFSIWCQTKAWTVQSEYVNIMQRPDLLIKVVLGLLCATETKACLDPLVTLLPDYSYLYEVPPKGCQSDSLFYQTRGLLSPWEFGRRVRVWRVRQVISKNDLRRVPGTTDRALKHAFCDGSRQTEDEIQNEMFRDIAAFAGRRDWKEDRLLKDFHPDDIESLEVALKGDFKKLFSCIIASHIGESYPSKPPYAIQGYTFGRCAPPNEVASFRRQCIFVYSDVCTSLCDIPTLGEQVDILKQCLVALRLMFCAGWVHRDISMGNILAYRATSEDAWVVKLTDFEYSKKIDSPCTETQRYIGTSHFMACETISKMRLPLSTNGPGQSTEDTVEKPIAPNYQHDLEGIWWIILFIVIFEVEGALMDEMEKANVLFRKFKDDTAQEYAMARINCLQGFLLNGHDTSIRVQPSLEAFTFDHLCDLRAQLWNQYVNRNREEAWDDVGTYSYIMSKPFHEFFAAIEESREEWGNIKIQVENPPQNGILEDDESEPEFSEEESEEEVIERVVSIGKDRAERSVKKRGFDEDENHDIGNAKRQCLTAGDKGGTPKDAQGDRVGNVRMTRGALRRIQAGVRDAI
ncbi:other/FunK1 protein kinase [Coprinopsis cinerea AmutBmut pab1-1]|nr:other/FunK1 protein kinase [Coprinopsis cinerea AmutBmut pab1-1]